MGLAEQKFFVSTMWDEEGRRYFSESNSDDLYIEAPNWTNSGGAKFVAILNGQKHGIAAVPWS
jgi:hypothetical protein